MGKKRQKEERVCPRCGERASQRNNGCNRSGTLTRVCGICGKYYTVNPKSKSYPEEVRQLAIKQHYAGASGRSIGRILGMSKSNVYNWIKKNGDGVDK